MVVKQRIIYFFIEGKVNCEVRPETHMTKHCTLTVNIRKLQELIEFGSDTILSKNCKTLFLKGHNNEVHGA